VAYFWVIKGDFFIALHNLVQGERLTKAIARKNLIKLNVFLMSLMVFLQVQMSKVTMAIKISDHQVSVKINKMFEICIIF
jgi:hypothetical protein